MRGESHLIASTFVFLPTFWVLYISTTSVYQRTALFLVFAGVWLGSLLPDLDAPDAKIMHGAWCPLGLIGKYLFYKPIVRILGTRWDLFGDEHRGFMHSLLGCILTSIFFVFIIGLPLIVSVLVWPDLLSFASLLGHVLLGVPIGFVLHLIEDSFTRSGVRWFSPRGKPILSTTHTWRGSEYFLVSVFGLVFSILLLILYLLPVSIITLLISVGTTAVLLVVLHKINPGISKLGDRLYTLEKLIRFYVEDIGGTGIKPSDEDCIPTIILKYENEAPKKPNIARIVGIGGKHRLDRKWLIEWDEFSKMEKGAISEFEASRMEPGDVFEVETSDFRGKLRVYYVVRNDLFCPFVRRTIP